MFCLNEKPLVNSLLSTKGKSMPSSYVPNLRKGLKGARINIFSDSQAALKALSSFKHESKLTWECLETLKLLARGNQVTLTWVPGHEGHDGNEKADELAKK
uniref:RNase H type-1 domain-containing protein n=1 Tax=Cacopsylla melanoneura TaxID=428564 RepID=A0A8D8XN72_9HEMI